MTEEFDIKLREKINQALDTEVESCSNKRWVEFEKKYSHFQTINRIKSYGRIAASVLLFVACGMLLVFIYKNIPTNEKNVQQENMYSQRLTAKGQQNDGNVWEKTALKNPTVKAKNNIRTKNRDNSQSKINEETESTHINNNYVASQITNQSGKVSPWDIVYKNNQNTKRALERKDSLISAMQANKLLEQNPLAKSDELDNSRFDFIEHNSKSYLRFGAEVSSIVNYDQANKSSKLNMGYGIFIEVPVLENLVVYSGILITNQTINFQNLTEEPISIGKHVMSKDLSLMGFDIPINLKYRFDMLSTKFFVSTGISSLAFIKEDIKTIYDVKSTVQTTTGNGIVKFETVSNKETETNSLGSFNDFFFAKILNLSFGFEIPINTRKTLLVEPYLKYSLGHLKSVEAYPSTLGLNLGIMF